MNQILSVENVNKKKNNKEKKRKSKEYKGSISEIVKIVRFFAISLIIFGLFNIGTGVYGMYRKKYEAANKPVKPEILAEATNKEVTFTINSKTAINEVYYKWDDEEETKISGNNRNIVQETIDMPEGEGEHNLYVRAVNTSGKVQTLEHTFIRESKIVIQIGSEDPNLVIKVEGKEDLAYVTYSWNGEDEQKIEGNGKTLEQKIEALPGSHTLIVTAVDVNGEEETIKKKINGIEPGDVAAGEEGSDEPEGSSQLTSKPTVEILVEQSRFYIKAKDTVGLGKIELVANDNTSEKISLDLDGRQEQEFEYPIASKQDSIAVTIYNTKGEAVTQKATAASRTQ